MVVLVFIQGKFVLACYTNENIHNTIWCRFGESVGQHDMDVLRIFIVFYVSYILCYCVLYSDFVCSLQIEL